MLQFVATYRLHELILGESNFFLGYTKVLSKSAEYDTGIVCVDGEADTIFSKLLDCMVFHLSRVCTLT